MGLQELQETLGQYYDVAYAGVAKTIRHEGQLAEEAALKSFGARGTAASGSSEKAISENIRGGTTRALANVKGQLAGQQAGILSGLYGEELSRNWQEEMIEKQRQWEVDDRFADIFTNLGSSVLAGPLAGLSAGAGYNITKEMVGPTGMDHLYGVKAPAKKVTTPTKGG